MLYQPDEKMDLRVLKTHQVIRKTFIELLLHHDYEKITVQDILDKALINRNTFYKYYAGKSDLAGKIIADFQRQHQIFINQRLQGKYSALLIMQGADFFFEHRHTILGLWKIKTKRHHLYEDMFNVVRQSFIQLAEQTHPQTQDWDYQAHCFATLVMTTAKYHFERDLPIPVENLWQKIRQITDIAQGEL